MRSCFSDGRYRTYTWDQRFMRADIQRKALGFQELTAPVYG